MAEFILKDWYGKDCKFDHDTIFVQDANGNLVQFTQGKGNPTLEALEVTENGTYEPSEGVDGFNSVVVEVPEKEPVLETLEATENGTYAPSAGVDGFGSVVVEVPTPEITLQDKTITENGTFTADDGFDGLGSVTVAVEGSGGATVAKMIEFTASGTTETITHGLGKIPLCVLVFPDQSFITSSLSADVMGMGFGVNEAVANMMGLESRMQYCEKWNTYSKVFVRNTANYSIESNNSNAIISNATEQSVKIGTSNCTLVAGIKYIAYVIG